MKIALGLVVSAVVLDGRLIVAAVVPLIVAALATTTGLATQRGSQDRDDDRQRDSDSREHDNDCLYAIGLGDLPVPILQPTVGVPNLIADMNSQRLAFSVHDGDLKTGNGAPPCKWVKVLVDCNSPEVFAYQPQIVPGNVPATTGR